MGSAGSGELSQGSGAAQVKQVWAAQGSPCHPSRLGPVSQVCPACDGGGHLLIGGTPPSSH